VRVTATKLECLLPAFAAAGLVMVVCAIAGAADNPWWAGPCFVMGFLSGTFSVVESMRRGIFP